jgi:hypothetical protein
VIVDADGSKYEGRIQAAAGQSQMLDETRPTAPAPATDSRRPTELALERARSPKGEASQAAAPANPAQAVNRQSRGQSAGEQVFFILSGTNRSLNQRVVFDGNLTVDQPLPRDRQTPRRDAAVKSPAPAAAPAERAPQMPARVQGRARFADGSEVDVDAVSIGP